MANCLIEFKTHDDSHERKRRRRRRNITNNFILCHTHCYMRRRRWWTAPFMTIDGHNSYYRRYKRERERDLSRATLETLAYGITDNYSYVIGTRARPSTFLISITLFLYDDDCNANTYTIRINDLRARACI